MQTTAYCGFPHFSCPHMAAITRCLKKVQTGLQLQKKRKKKEPATVCVTWGWKVLSSHRRKVHSAGWESTLGQNKVLWLQVCHIILYTWYILVSWWREGPITSLYKVQFYGRDSALNTTQHGLPLTDSSILKHECMCNWPQWQCFFFFFLLSWPCRSFDRADHVYQLSVLPSPSSG